MVGGQYCVCCQADSEKQAADTRPRAGGPRCPQRNSRDCPAQWLADRGSPGQRGSLRGSRFVCQHGQAMTWGAGTLCPVLQVAGRSGGPISTDTAVLVGHRAERPGLAARAQLPQGLMCRSWTNTLDGEPHHGNPRLDDSFSRRPNSASLTRTRDRALNTDTWPCRAQGEARRGRTPEGLPSLLPTAQTHGHSTHGSEATLLPNCPAPLSQE